MNGDIAIAEALIPGASAINELVDLERGLVASTLFTDSILYRLELERIFRRSWVFVAHETEIPNVGDFVARRMGDDPVIVVRGPDDAVRVLLNSCRHRGRMVCTEDLGNTTHFQCPYHGWTYKTTGELTGVPFDEQYGGRLDRSVLGLRGAPSVDTYHGLIFACWDVDQTPLVEYLDAIGWVLDLVAGRSGGMEVIGPPIRWISDFNWKLGAGNFAGDTHHLPVTHGFVRQLGFRSTRKAHRTGHTLISQNGHAMGSITTEGSDDPYMMSALAPETVEKIRRTLVGGQLEYFAKLQSIVGNVFPNLSFLETSAHDAHEWGGPSGQVISLNTIRQWQPFAPNKTEILTWLLVDTSAPEWWKDLSRQCYEREFGLAGLFEQDDTENWARINDGVSGSVGREQWLHYGLAFDDKPADNWTGPGTLYVHEQGSLGEGNERAFYDQWRQMMTNDG